MLTIYVIAVVFKQMLRLAEMSVVSNSEGFRTHGAWVPRVLTTIDHLGTVTT